MCITFRNSSTSEQMNLFFEGKTYCIEPSDCVEVFTDKTEPVFSVSTTVFNELKSILLEPDVSTEHVQLKDKLLSKMATKFAEKIPQEILHVCVDYELTCRQLMNPVVDLQEGMYSLCDGKIADWLDLFPVVYAFARAETNDGTIAVRSIRTDNRKQYLKNIRKLLLILNWRLFLLDLFVFVPEYACVCLLASDFFISRLLRWLYQMSAAEREKIIAAKAELSEQGEKKKGFLQRFLRILVVILIIGGICWWGITSDPEVYVAQDFSSVVCFNETFIRIEGGLPADAERVYFEDYSAFYPLADGEYDMDNYHCYIYETPDGTRYMWLKDNCSDEQSDAKEYEDYRNPLVFKVTENAEE